jgi:uncharacterized BrkB/YihY/UPF0761 family membrane protein
MPPFLGLPTGTLASGFPHLMLYLAVVWTVLILSMAWAASLNKNKDR